MKPEAWFLKVLAKALLLTMNLDHPPQECHMKTETAPSKVQIYYHCQEATNQNICSTFKYP